MIIKHDTSNKRGLRFDYVKDGKIIAYSYGDNAKNDGEVESEFNGTVQLFEDNAELVAEKNLLNLSNNEKVWIKEQLLIVSSKIEDLEDAGSSSGQFRTHRLAIKNWPNHADFPDSTKRPSL